MTVSNSPQPSIEQLRQALAVHPALPAGHYHLGNLLLQSGRREEAVEAFRQAVRQNLNDQNALIQLGGTLHSLERCTEALVALRTAVALEPTSLPARLMLGTALSATEDYEGAVKQLSAALKLDSHSIPAWMNLGHALLGARQFEAAVDAFTQALSLDPNFALARLNRALAWMAAGDFEQGLPEYESRLHLIESERASPGIAWHGEPLAEATLLIQAEQGLGDTLQFMRFVPMAKARATRIVFQVQDTLFPLLKPLEKRWGIAVTTVGSVPPTDRFCSLLSLPLLLGASLVEPPSSTPYLEVPEPYKRKWTGALTHVGKRKIGLAWSGRIRPYENRAIPVAHLAPLFDIPDIDWIVLQKNVAPADKEWLASNQRTSMALRFSDRIDNFADTAALVEQLDHIVSIDTSIAHLAGSLNRPVSIVLPYAADWRWHADVNRSPWYPSANLYWQARPGDWADAIEQLAPDLRQ